MTPENLFRKGVVTRVSWYLNFLALKEIEYGELCGYVTYDVI